MALLASSTLVIAVVDYWTGPDVGFSLFYLIPVSIGGRYLPRAAAVMLAVLAAGGWLAADSAWHGFGLVPFWNGCTRLAIFAGAAIAVSQLRRDTERVAELNARLRTLLDQEQRLSRTDGVTGLGNARLFDEAYGRSFALWRRNHEPLAVVCVDLDNFKQVNDTRGHAAGDELLKQIAAAMSRVLRAGDVATRLGGDEFAILLHECPPEIAGRVGERLLQQIRSTTEPFPELGLGASLGIACFDVPPATAQAALRVADGALYTAKSNGKNRVEVVNGH